jgi:hypothetical protein
MRLAILHRPGGAAGGDLIAANAYARELKSLGAEVELIPANNLQDFSRFDFVQLYAACSPDWGLEAAREVTLQGIPLIVSPFWWSRSERQAFYGQPGDLYDGYTEAVAETLRMANYPIYGNGIGSSRMLEVSP